VVALVMTLRDVIAKLWAALKRAAARTGEVANKLWEQTKNRWVDITTKMRNDFAKGNVKAAGAAFLTLAGFLPVVIAAVAEDDPDIGEIAADVAQIQPEVAKGLKQSESIYADANKRATENLPPEQKPAAIRGQIERLNSQLDTVCKGVTSAYCNRPAQSQPPTGTTPPASKTPATKTPATKTPATTPPASKTPAPPAKKGGVGAALALAAGGLVVGGPVGAGIGLVIGLTAGGKKA
jgi:hypothetical protein